MSWLKIDDGFAEHPKIGDLSDRSFRLHVAALCYSARNLTDGHLSPKAVKVLAAIINAGRVSANLKELVNAEVWIDNGDGSFSIYGYLEHNPPAEEIKRKRDERKAAGKKGAEARWGKPDPEATSIDEAMATAIGSRNGVTAMPPDPDPDPDPLSEKPVFSVTMESALESLANSVTNADGKTLRTFRKQVEALDRLDAGYVSRLAGECCAAGDKGAGWALNALRKEHARRMIAGLSLRAIDGGAA